nr:hypothetical transcript [Hymenolepis microstoma]
MSVNDSLLYSKLFKESFNEEALSLQSRLSQTKFYLCLSTPLMSLMQIGIDDLPYCHNLLSLLSCEKLPTMHYCGNK